MTWVLEMILWIWWQKATKAKIHRWDWIRLKSRARQRKPSTKLKVKPLNEIKYLQIVSVNLLISKIQKELTHHNSKKCIWLKNKIWINIFSKEDIERASYMQGCSALPMTREMQIKTKMKCHFTLVKMANNKKTKNNKCWWEFREKDTLVACWWECKLIQPLWKTIWRFLQKLKSRISIWSSNSTPGNICEGNKTLCQRDIYISMFTATLFLTVKIWKLPMGLLMDEQIKKMWNVYTVEYNSVMRKKENLPFVTTWIGLRALC